MKKFLTLITLSASTTIASAQTLADAIKLTDKEQFEKATQAFKKLLTAEPQNGEVWFYFGENYWENERADSAEVCYRQGNGVGGKFPLNKVGLGKALWSKGKKDEAQAMFTQAEIRPLHLRVGPARRLHPDPRPLGITALRRQNIL